jgi:IS605 OrfB family transposase
MAAPATYIPLDAVQIGARYRRDLGDIDGLARSIADVGLLHPIVVRPDGLLIAGERRLEACRRLGWATVPVTEVDLEQVVRGELAENADRKDFLPSEIDAIRKALAPIEAAAAKERIETGRPPQGKFPEGQAGRTREKVGAFAGVSGRTVEKIGKVMEAAEREPEKFAPLVAEMDRTGRVDVAYKKMTTAQKAEAIAADPPPLSRGPSRVIVADPPWTYANRADLIAVEDLNVRNMIRHPPLARSIADASWSKFLSFLAYKAERAGVHFVRVDPRNTSQKCSGCGELVPKSLAVRIHAVGARLKCHPSAR